MTEVGKHCPRGGRAGDGLQTRKGPAGALVFFNGPIARKGRKNEQKPIHREQEPGMIYSHFYLT